MADYKKLQAFVEAACTNPRHPVYKLGMQHSPILRHYAVNVMTLGAVEPAQWFREDVQRTAKIEQVMALCEADETEDAELAALKQQVAELTTKLAAQAAPVASAPAPAPEAPAETPAPETPAGQDA